MGSSVSTSVIENFKTKDPPFEKFLLNKLVKYLPDQIEEVNSAKMDFVDACKQFIPRREYAINQMTKMLQHSIDRTNHDNIINTLKIFDLGFKIVTLMCTIFSLLTPKIGLSIFATSLIIDIIIYLYSISNKPKIEIYRNCMRTIEPDRAHLAMAKNSLNTFRKQFIALENEITHFSNEVNSRYLDVSCKDPEIKKFFRRVRHVEGKNEICDFMEALIDLIDDSIVHEYKHDSDDESRGAYYRFMEKCQSTVQNTEMLMKDLDLYYSTIDMTDTTNLGILILLRDFEFSFDKISRIRQSLLDELECIKNLVENVKQKEKI